MLSCRPFSYSVATDIDENRCSVSADSSFTFAAGGISFSLLFVELYMYSFDSMI